MRLRRSVSLVSAAVSFSCDRKKANDGGGPVQCKAKCHFSVERIQVVRCRGDETGNGGIDLGSK
jgi:hypothetical protein